MFAIRTLGFRGEALPSIAAVSKPTLISRAAGEESGAQIRVDGGKIIEQRAQGAPQGTLVTVEDLFRHVPARLKFLKTPATEAGRIADLINAYALAYPQLRFSLVNDDRLVFQSPGTGRMFDALVKVFGIDVAEQMIEVGNLKLEDGSWKLEGDSPPTSNYHVSGFISPPNVNRSTRKYMLFFVNHRWIQDRTIQHAVIEAYHTALMVGRAPIVALDIVVPPDMVDVNVHPTKSEVRFRDTSAVFTAVQRAVRAVLTGNAPIPSIGVTMPPAPQPFPSSPAPTQSAMNLYRPSTMPNETAPISNLQPPISNVQIPMLRVLGQIASTYIIAEGPDGLYLIDQHAAHERVLYEQLTAERAGTTVAVQELLDPAPLQLTPAQTGALETHRAALE